MSNRSVSGSLHRIDPKVPAAEQFDAVKSLLDAKIIRHAGLSEVSVADIEAASKHFRVATVQNRYNLRRPHQRGRARLLRRAQCIGFIPWFPLAAGDLAKEGSLLDIIAEEAWGCSEPDRARLGPEAQPGHAADPRHRQGQASRREHGGGEHHAVR